MSAKAPVVSVLTPVYNGERHLAECIESVIAQTYQDWEYVIVDNVSKDRSAEIAADYARQDSRIRLIRCEEFLGVHHNFCRALKLSHPETRYIKFVSADDWIYPECLERMVSVAERHPSVGVVSAYKLIGNRLGHDALLPYTQEITSGVEAIRGALLRGAYVTGSPTQLMFRADLARAVDPFFDETAWHSDTDAAFRTLMKCDLGFVHQVLTFTRLHPNALTSSYSQRINTYISSEIRLLFRYGKQALSPQEYRMMMRTRLRQYAWFLGKQRIKLARFNDEAFQRFHHKEIRSLLAEPANDRETRMLLQWIRAMLLRHVGTKRLGWTV